jgi:hypothetical protein
MISAAIFATHGIEMFESRDDLHPVAHGFK